MKKGVTSAGFRFRVDEDMLDDMRFIDVLAVVVDESTPDLDRIAGASKLTEMILGRQQKAALYAFIGKSHNGRVPRDELIRALNEIVAAGRGKEAAKN